MSSSLTDEEKAKQDQIDALFGLPSGTSSSAASPEVEKKKTDDITTEDTAGEQQETERGVVKKQMSQDEQIDALFGLNSTTTSKAGSPSQHVDPNSNSNNNTTSASSDDGGLAGLDELVKRSSTLIAEGHSGMISAEENGGGDGSGSAGGNGLTAPQSNQSLTSSHLDTPTTADAPSSNSLKGSMAGPSLTKSSSSSAGRKRGKVGHMCSTFSLKASSVFEHLAPPPGPEEPEKEPETEAEIKAAAKKKKQIEEDRTWKFLPEIMNMPLPLRCDFCIKFDSVCSQCHFKWKDFLKIKQRALSHTIGGMVEPEIVVMIFGTAARGTPDFFKVLLDLRPNALHWILNFKPIRGEGAELAENMEEAGRVFPLHVACAYNKHLLATVLFEAGAPVRRSEYRIDAISVIPKDKRESRAVEKEKIQKKKEEEERMWKEEQAAKKRAKRQEAIEEAEAEGREPPPEEPEEEEEEPVEPEETGKEEGTDDEKKQLILANEEEALWYIQAITAEDLSDDEDDDGEFEIRLGAAWENMLAKHTQCRMYFSLEKAKSLRRDERFNEALDLYDEALKEWPGSEGALCGLAKMFLDQGHYSKCIKQCDAILASRGQVDWVEFSPETIAQLRQSACEKRYSTENTVLSLRKIPFEIIKKNILPFANTLDNYRLYRAVRNPMLQRATEDAAARACDSSTGALLSQEPGYEEMYESIRTDHPDPETNRTFGKFEKFLGIQVVAMGDFHTYIVRAGARVANPKFRIKKKSSWFGSSKEETNDEPQFIVATKLYRINRFGVGAKAWEVQDSGEWEVADPSLELGGAPAA